MRVLPAAAPKRARGRDSRASDLQSPSFREASGGQHAGLEREEETLRKDVASGETGLSRAREGAASESHTGWQGGFCDRLVVLQQRGPAAGLRPPGPSEQGPPDDEVAG